MSYDIFKGHEKEEVGVLDFIPVETGIPKWMEEFVDDSVVGDVDQPLYLATELTPKNIVDLTPRNEVEVIGDFFEAKGYFNSLGFIYDKDHEAVIHPETGEPLHYRDAYEVAKEYFAENDAKKLVENDIPEAHTVSKFTLAFQNARNAYLGADTYFGVYKPKYRTDITTLLKQTYYMKLPRNVIFLEEEDENINYINQYENEVDISNRYETVLRPLSEMIRLTTMGAEVRLAHRQELLPLLADIEYALMGFENVGTWAYYEHDLDEETYEMVKTFYLEFSNHNRIFIDSHKNDITDIAYIRDEEGNEYIADDYTIEDLMDSASKPRKAVINKPKKSRRMKRPDYIPPM